MNETPSSSAACVRCGRAGSRGFVVGPLGRVCRNGDACLDRMKPKVLDFVIRNGLVYFQPSGAEDV